MKTLTSNLPTLPAYHQRMLLVKSSTETLPSALAEFKEHGLGQVTGLAQQMERAAAAGAFSASSGSSTFPPARQPDPNAGVFLIEFSDDKQLAERERQLASDTEIAKVSRVPIRYAVAGSNFPAFPNPNTRLWNLEKIGFYELNGPHDFTGDAHVALLDTGIDSGHPNLPRPAKYFYDHQILGSMSGQEDIHGHGTHVAGIVCAKESSTTSICGICKCQVSVWKIFNDVPELIKDVPEPYFTYVVDPAMYFRTLGDCLTSEIKIINLSIGGPTEPDFQEAELWQRLIGAGKVAVAAMGNTGDDVKQYPAAIPGVIAVGATDNDDQVASFSGRGEYICVCAPGTGIWSTLPTYPGQDRFSAAIQNGEWEKQFPIARETHFGSYNGTSMAAPHVTAALALFSRRIGKLTPTDAKEALRKSSDRVSGMNGETFTPGYGYGRLNLTRLMQL